MWAANKVAIICLLGGLALLGCAYWVLHEQEPLLARQVLSAGVCILLFATALGSWLSVRRKLRR